MTDKDQSILAIWGQEPQRDQEHPKAFAVGLPWHPGRADVERIAIREDNYGDHGIAWFDVYAGGNRVASMNARAVAEVRYLIDYSAMPPADGDS